MPTKPKASKPATKTPVKRPGTAIRKAASPSPSTSPAKRKTPSPKAPATPPVAAPEAAGGSKQAQLIALLRSPAGATVSMMTDLTGWQAHTVRGTISGVLRKRLGLTVTTEADKDSPRVYRIAA